MCLKKISKYGKQKQNISDADSTLGGISTKKKII